MVCGPMRLSPGHDGISTLLASEYPLKRSPFFASPERSNRRLHGVSDILTMGQEALSAKSCKLLNYGENAGLARFLLRIEYPP